MGMSDLWYENAIIYCLDVETYQDSNGDGIGDFPGLTRRLDYISGLGVTCLWLMPFFPSPGRDDGYDVTDYYTVDPRLGTLADFVEFTNEAAERGIRVVVDMVLNHTSIEHPWFQAARSSRDNPYRDYYVWSTKPPQDTSDEVVFPGQQTGIWTWDDTAGAAYLHHFYDHQADLNMTNKTVRDELRKIIGLWLELGVSGFRIDAAPFMIDMTGVADNVDVHDPHRYLQDLRDFLSVRSGDAIFLGEVDLGPTEIAVYFGGGNEFQMLFNFLLNRDLFLALATERASPISRSLRDMPKIPRAGQWANFLRHHDELNLSRLMPEEREAVYKVFGSAPEMKIYERGLRRRLAPMLGGDRKRLELAFSLLFSLPGAPAFFYGDEIGMGEDLDLPERFSVRTPMQWSNEPNGGFSTAPADQMVRPMRAGGKYGYRRVNVTDQRRDRDSFLNWVASLIRTRKECPEFGWGNWSEIESGEPAVFAHECIWEDGGCVVAVHNLSRDDLSISLDIPDDECKRLFQVFGSRDDERPLADGPLALEGYGYRWYRRDGLR
jgi:maltose alpha-D-glucosyltransferase/alpha-amylase